jgi:hypothetical protein
MAHCVSGRPVRRPEPSKDQEEGSRGEEEDGGPVRTNMRCDLLPRAGSVAAK